MLVLMVYFLPSFKKKKKKEFLFSDVVKTCPETNISYISTSEYWKMLRFKLLSYINVHNFDISPWIFFISTFITDLCRKCDVASLALFLFLFNLPVSIKKICSCQIFAQYFPSLFKPVGLKKIYPYVCN